MRKYTDTRVIVDFFTLQKGRISGVIRVSKKHRSNLQPFYSVQISWRGARDLKTIVACELDSNNTFTLSEKQLYCGLYLNELLQRVLPLDDPSCAVFLEYEKSLLALSKVTTNIEMEPILRKFEFLLLTEMGFGINIVECVVSGETISENSEYFYRPGEGFFLAHKAVDRSPGSTIAGFDLIAISQQNYQRVSTLKVAKQITREALKPMLGSKPLKSRELFY